MPTVTVRIESPEMSERVGGGDDREGDQLGAERPDGGLHPRGPGRHPGEHAGGGVDRWRWGPPRLQATGVATLSPFLSSGAGGELHRFADFDGCPGPARVTSIPTTPARAFVEPAAPASQRATHASRRPAPHIVSRAGLPAMSRSAVSACRIQRSASGPLGGRARNARRCSAACWSVAPLEQQEGHAVVRTHQAFVQLEGALVVADGLFGLARLGEGDRHVQQDARVGRVVPEREPVRRERGLEVALPLERQPLVQVVQPLRAQRLPRSLAEQACQKLMRRAGTLRAKSNGDNVLDSGKDSPRRKAPQRGRDGARERARLLARGRA